MITTEKSVSSDPIIILVGLRKFDTIYGPQVIIFFVVAYGYFVM